MSENGNTTRELSVDVRRESRKRAGLSSVVRAVLSAAVGAALVVAVLLWLNGCGTETHELNSADGSGAGSGAGAGAGTGGTSGSGSGGTGGAPVVGSGGEPAGGTGGSTSSETCPPNVAIPAICHLCPDGSCGQPVCENGQFSGDWSCPENLPTRTECVTGGCSGQLCVDASQQPPITTCEERPEYACYDTATCEVQRDGTCGWTSTPELTRCLAEASGQ